MSDADLNHEFLPVLCHPDDDECTFRSDGTDLTYCGEPKSAHGTAPVPAAPNEYTPTLDELFDLCHLGAIDAAGDHLDLAGLRAQFDRAIRQVRDAALTEAAIAVVRALNEIGAIQPHSVAAYKGDSFSTGRQHP